MLYAAVIDDAEDIKKFEKIYYEYREQMFFVANKILRDSYEAEDAVQNALLGIARSIRTVSYTHLVPRAPRREHPG